MIRLQSMRVSNKLQDPEELQRRPLRRSSSTLHRPYRAAQILLTAGYVRR